MMAIILDWLSSVFILLGSGFVVIGAIGLVRMPDLFTRMQAVSVIETTGAGLILVGFMIEAGISLVTLKLLFILALLFFIGPVITHAVAQAALHDGIEPQLAEDRRNRPDMDDL